MGLLLQDGGWSAEGMGTQVGVGDRLDSLLDNVGDNWGSDDWEGSGLDHWDWGSLNHHGFWGRSDSGGSNWQGSWGSGVWQVVWVVEVVVGVEVVVVVVPVVQVVVGVENVGVVVVVAIEVGSLGFGLGFSLSGGLTLGQSVGAEGQSSATAWGDTVVSTVWAKLGNDCWACEGWGHQGSWGGSDKGWGSEGWGNHWLLGDYSRDGLDGGCSNIGSRGKGSWEGEGGVGSGWKGSGNWGQGSGEWGGN